MRTLTHRAIVHMAPNERHERRREPPQPRRTIEGQKVHISGRSMWRGYWYGKGAIAKWNRADQVLMGKWNYYTGRQVHTAQISLLEMHHATALGAQVGHGTGKTSAVVVREREGEGIAHPHREQAAGRQNSECGVRGAPNAHVVHAPSTGAHPKEHVRGNCGEEKTGHGAASSPAPAPANEEANRPAYPHFAEGKPFYAPELFAIICNFGQSAASSVAHDNGVAGWKTAPREAPGAAPRIGGKRRLPPSGAGLNSGNGLPECGQLPSPHLQNPANAILAFSDALSSELARALALFQGFLGGNAAHMRPANAAHVRTTGIGTHEGTPPNASHEASAQTAAPIVGNEYVGREVSIHRGGSRHTPSHDSQKKRGIRLKVARADAIPPQ